MEGKGVIRELGITAPGSFSAGELCCGGRREEAHNWDIYILIALSLVLFILARLALHCFKITY
jgi:hypothetical protein